MRHPSRLSNFCASDRGQELDRGLLVPAVLGFCQIQADAGVSATEVMCLSQEIFPGSSGLDCNGSWEHSISRRDCGHNGIKNSPNTSEDNAAIRS
jgi:hypothetical protein